MIQSVNNSCIPFERSHFLQKKYFSLWRQFAARGCPLGTPPLEVLKKKIFLVHATDMIPTQGKLVAGCQHTFVEDGRPYSASLRQTLHFALNGLVRGHGFNCWEKKKSALLVPLEDVNDRLLSICPYDTSIVGDLALKPSMTLIVPEDVPRELLPAGVSTITYKSSEKLRMVIERVIQARKGWLIETSPHVLSATGSARCSLFHKTEINAFSFFRQLLKANPSLSLGSHQSSLFGEAWRIGELDMQINPLIENYLLFSKGKALAKGIAKKNLSNHDLQFLVCYIDHQLDAIARFANTLSTHFKQPLETFIREARVWQLFLQIDLNLRQKKGRKLVCVDKPEVEEWIRKTTDQLRASLEKGQAAPIEEYVEEAERLNLTELPSWQDQYDWKTIASLCYQMPDDELLSFLAKLEIRTSLTLSLVRFHAYLYRWMLRGEEHGRINLNRLFDELKQNPSEHRVFISYLKQDRYDNPINPYHRSTVILTARLNFQHLLWDIEHCDKSNHRMKVRLQAILQYLDTLASSST